MHLHRRQFVLGPHPLSVHDDWVCEDLAGGMCLSRCPALPVERTGAWTLLGVAVQTDAGGRDPAEELARGEDLAGQTDSWAGRWVLLGRDRVQLDAAGTLSCFFRRIGVDLWISSSPELLRALEPELPLPDTLLEHARGMDWYPPPGSGIDGIERLLPSQTLRFDGDIEPRRLLPDSPARSYGDLLESLEGRLQTALTNLARGGGSMLLPLSAGRDSRLLLAAAAGAGVEVSAYTLDWQGIDRGDRELPSRLAGAVGYEHRLIAPSAPEKRRLELFDTHTARHCVDIDRHFFACRQLDEIADSAVDLGGGVFETGRCYYHGGLPNELPATAEQTTAAIQAGLPTVRPNALHAWAEWVDRTHDPAVDWRDRFYLEQRAAGWLSTIALGLDLARVPRLHVASCGAYLAETLALPAEVRRVGVHHDHMVRRMAPALAAFPFNPPRSAQARVTRRLRRELDEYRQQAGPVRYMSTRVRQLLARRATRQLC